MEDVKVDGVGVTGLTGGGLDKALLINDRQNLPSRPVGSRGLAPAFLLQLPETCKPPAVMGVDIEKRSKYPR
jgi:hypothetical protein